MKPKFQERHNRMPTALGHSAALIAKAARPVVRRAIARDRNAAGVNQERVLRFIVRNSAETHWGRQHKFDTIAKSKTLIADYQQAIGLAEYEVFRELVNRMRSGEPNVLWPGRVKYYAVSSGTISQGKLIPASTAMLRCIRAASMRTVAHYMAESGNYSILKGNVLALPGHHSRDRSNEDVAVGEMSSIVALSSPKFVADYWQAVGPQTLQMTDWDAKLREVVKKVKKADITALAMVPTWAVRIIPAIISERENICRSKGDGIHAVWPNLKVFFSSGVALSSYKDALMKFTGNRGLDFIEMYTASEGFFAYQDKPEADDMLLATTNGVFFEFIKFEELNDEKPKRYTVHNIEKGQKYVMYVTTCSGLFAYGMRDVVTFTSTNPPRIKVSGRTTEMLDKYGEAVFVDEIEIAVAKACRATKSTFRNYHVSTSAMVGATIPHHQYFVEFTASRPERAVFERVLDNELASRNRHYRIRRQAKVLGHPELLFVRRGAFDCWVRSTRGKISAQSKIPRISESRTIAESLSKMCT